MNKWTFTKRIIVALLCGWCLVFGCYCTLISIYNSISPVEATSLIKLIFVIIAVLLWDLLLTKVDYTKQSSFKIDTKVCRYCCFSPLKIREVL